MSSLPALLWIETRKAVRSRLPLWTALASLLFPLGVAFLIFVSRNPALSRQLGLISAKADVMGFAEVDWPGYLRIFGQLIATAGYMLFVFVVSWVFGREFADGTVKDLLAVPVTRASVLLAKFIVVAVWAAGLAVVILAGGLVTGSVFHFTGGSLAVIASESARLLGAAGLVILMVLPFAFFASAGRGYLLPIGMAVLSLLLTNIVIVIGWGDYFPLSIPGLLAQGSLALAPVQLVIVGVTALAGLLATYAWWQTADQPR